MDKEAFIVGGGPSLSRFNWMALNNKFVVAVNRAYEVLPNAQIIYITDPDFYYQHKKAMHNHAGEIVRGHLPGQSVNDTKVREITLSGSDGLDMRPGFLKHGSNSVYAAINLLVQIGYKKIYLLGVDMKWEGKKTHWHSGHKRCDPESVYAKMIKSFNTIVEPLKQQKVTVINLNPDSGLTVFPFLPAEQILGKCFL